MSRGALALYVRAVFQSQVAAGRVRAILHPGRIASSEDDPEEVGPITAMIDLADEAELWSEHAEQSVVGATWDVDASVALAESVARDEVPAEASDVLTALAACGASSIYACLDCDPEAGPDGAMYIRFVDGQAEVIALSEGEREELFELDFPEALAQLEKRFAR